MKERAVGVFDLHTVENLHAVEANILKLPLMHSEQELHSANVDERYDSASKSRIAPVRCEPDDNIAITRRVEIFVQVIYVHREICRHEHHPFASRIPDARHKRSTNPAIVAVVKRANIRRYSSEIVRRLARFVNARIVHDNDFV